MRIFSHMRGPVVQRTHKTLQDYSNRPKAAKIVYLYIFCLYFNLLQFKPSDIVIMTYPKCGTTWTQEIIWTLLKNPNLDNSDANLPIFVRSPFIE